MNHGETGRPELAHIPAKRQGRLLVSPTLFEDVCKVICTTNTTWAQTKGMTTRIVHTFGPPWPGDRSRRAFPTPSQIAVVPFEEFAAATRLGYRAQAVHRLAVDLAGGNMDLEAWRDRAVASPDLWKRLLSLRGIGPYGAACLMLYLGRGDRVNVDSWARTMVSRELGRPVTDSEVHAFFEPYGEWRGLVYSFYDWRGEEATDSIRC